MKEKKNGIENTLKEQKRQSIIHTWLSTIISVIGGFLIGYLIFEEVTISSFETITNDSIIITFKNEHLLKPTSKIVVWGWDAVNGEVVIDSISRGSLEPQENITRTYPIGKINISLENFSAINVIPAGRIFIRNTLFYRVTCIDCDGQDYWRPLREDVMNIAVKCNFNETVRVPTCQSDFYTQIFWKLP